MTTPRYLRSLARHAMNRVSPCRPPPTPPPPTPAIRMLVERPIDLLITDVQMAELNGYELARQAKLMSPRLKVIYMTGGVTDDERGDGPVYGPLVLKPIGALALMRRIKRELAAAV